MIDINRKNSFFQIVTAITFLMLLAVLFIPAALGAQEPDCLDSCCDDCEEHSEAVCICIGCLPATIGFVTTIFEDSYKLEILSSSVIALPVEIEFDFLAQVDRPPKLLFN